MQKIPSGPPRLIHSERGEKMMRWYGLMYEALQQRREVWLLRTHKPVTVF